MTIDHRRCRGMRKIGKRKNGSTRSKGSKVQAMKTHRI